MQKIVLEELHCGKYTVSSLVVDNGHGIKEKCENNYFGSLPCVIFSLTVQYDHVFLSELLLNTFTDYRGLQVHVQTGENGTHFQLYWIIFYSVM